MPHLPPTAKSDAIVIESTPPLTARSTLTFRSTDGSKSRNFSSNACGEIISLLLGADRVGKSDCKQLLELDTGTFIYLTRLPVLLL